DMKRATDVQGGMRAKQDATWIEQIQVCPRNGRLQSSVDKGLLPTSDPAQDIDDRGGTSECGTLSPLHIELSKAVKQIRPAELPYVVGNIIVRPGQRTAWSETAVQSHLGLTAGEQETE